MKLNEITETGYYTGELDTERETIFEVIKNTDEVWLKEAPEQTLLIDEWTYEYTDEDGRKHYEIYGGNLVSVVNAEPFDVVKITDTKYTMDVSDPTIASKCNGTSMMEDKPTRLEIAEQQLKHKEQECEKLKEDEKSLLNVIDHLQKTKNEWEEKYNDLGQDFDQLKAENEKLKSEIKHYKQIAQYHGNLSVKYTNKSAKLKQTLAEIKVICNNNDELQGDFNVVDCDKYKLGKHNLANKVLQKIKEYRVEE